MAEIKLTYPSGYSIYYLIFDSSNQVYNKTEFVAYEEAGLALYAYTMTDNGGDNYTAEFPALAVDSYELKYYIKPDAGSDPMTSDIYIDNDEVIYNGSEALYEDPEPDIIGIQTYIDVATADQYHSSLYNKPIWAASSLSDRQKALIMATRIISSLSFSGEKTVEAQLLEFPRYAQSIIPRDIQHACCEIAYAILDGFDPDATNEEQRIKTAKFEGVSTTYDTRISPEYITAGVPSVRAWSLLLPYLLSPQGINISRV